MEKFQHDTTTGYLFTSLQREIGSEFRVMTLWWLVTTHSSKFSKRNYIFPLNSQKVVTYFGQIFGQNKAWGTAIRERKSNFFFLILNSAARVVRKEKRIWKPNKKFVKRKNLNVCSTYVFAFITTPIFTTSWEF